MSNIEEAKKRAERLRKAMLYLGEYVDEDREEVSDEGIVLLIGASTVLRGWAMAGKKRGYESETIDKLVDVHNSTVQFINDPESIDPESLAMEYADYYGRMANHVVEMINQEKSTLSGHDDKTYY